MISKPTTVEQIDDWRAADSENEILEFKEAKEQFNFADLLSYCVAIANEFGGVLLLGVSDKSPRPVVGTKAYPHVNRLKKDILDRLHFRVDIEAVAHPDGRVLVFHIPPRPTGHPYHFDGRYLMRSGESLVPMTTDQIQQIVDEAMSPLAKKILYMVGTIAAVVILLLLYVGTEHLWRTETQSLDHKTTAKQAEAKTSEQQQPANKTPSSSNSHKPLAIKSVDWHDKHNWRKYLRVGMTKSEVSQLFGEAEKITVITDSEYWDYGLGSITFKVDASHPDGSLYEWSEPSD